MSKQRCVRTWMNTLEYSEAIFFAYCLLPIATTVDNVNEKRLKHKRKCTAILTTHPDDIGEVMCRPNFVLCLF